jgi:hypothetical protein
LVQETGKGNKKTESEKKDQSWIISFFFRKIAW